MILSLVPEAFYSTLLVSAWGSPSIHLISQWESLQDALFLHVGEFQVMGKLWGELANSQPRPWALQHEQTVALSSAPPVWLFLVPLLQHKFKPGEG